MTAFRDRLAEALGVRYGSNEHWADHLIESEVVADPETVAELAGLVAQVKNAQSERLAAAWAEGWWANNGYHGLDENPYRPGPQAGS